MGGLDKYTQANFGKPEDSNTMTAPLHCTKRMCQISLLDNAHKNKTIFVFAYMYGLPCSSNRVSKWSRLGR